MASVARAEMSANQESLSEKALSPIGFRNETARRSGEGCALDRSLLLPQGGGTLIDRG